MGGIESLRTLCDACHEIELAEERNELPEQRWLNQMIAPGTSLGGARPKANVVDTDGKLYVAKFPSKADLENTELIEHFSHQLAAKAGIHVATTRTIKISKDRNLLLSASESYMLERKEAAEIIEEVRSVIKDWRRTAQEQQVPLKLLESYSMRWDELSNG